MIPLIPSKSRGGREKGWGVHRHSALFDWGPHSLASFFHVKYNDCHEREPHLYSNAQYRTGVANRNNLELCLLTFPLNYMKKVNFEQTAAWSKKSGSEWHTWGHTTQIEIHSPPYCFAEKVIVILHCLADGHLLSAGLWQLKVLLDGTWCNLGWKKRVIGGEKKPHNIVSLFIIVSQPFVILMNF